MARLDDFPTVLPAAQALAGADYLLVWQSVAGVLTPAMTTTTALAAAVNALSATTNIIVDHTNARTLTLADLTSNALIVFDTTVAPTVATVTIPRHATVAAPQGAVCAVMATQARVQVVGAAGLPTPVAPNGLFSRAVGSKIEILNLDGNESYDVDGDASLT